MSQGTPQDQGVYGFWRPSSDNSLLNQLSFLIQTALARVNVAVPVKVVAVHSLGRGAGIGTVDVQPLVSMVDGQGGAWPHATVYGLPWCRPGGGGSAFIADPAAGDIGLAVFCDRDISSVKAAQGVAQPGSFRRFSMVDGIYFGTIISTAAPARAIILDSSGCEITAPVKVDGSVDLEGGGVLKVNGTQVVGPQLAHINAAVGGTTVDSQCRAVQFQILNLLQLHGLMS